MKYIISIALILVACGKSQPAPAPDTTIITGVADATRAGDDAAATPDVASDGAAADAAPSDASADGEVAEELRLMQRLGALEVPGMTKGASQVHNDYVTLQFATATPNAKGNTASIEATIGFCAGCLAATKAEIEQRKEQSLAQLGDLHAKNPSLVFTQEDLELMPQRVGLATYVRSFVDDGTTRAAMHTLEVTFIGSDKSLRFLVYPRSNFPQSQAEMVEAFSKEDMVAAVKSVFAAAAKILWP